MHIKILIDSAVTRLKCCLAKRKNLSVDSIMRMQLKKKKYSGLCLIFREHSQKYAYTKKKFCFLAYTNVAFWLCYTVYIIIKLSAFRKKNYLFFNVIRD